MKRFLLILLGFIGVTAVSCGAMMMLEPTGSLLLLDLHWLKPTPFTNYVIPGLILSGVGTVNFYAWYAVKTEQKAALWWAVAAGVLMIGFEVVQMLMLQMTYWLQYLYIILGFFTVLMSLQLKHKELI
jgi:hypothetical protein